MDNLIHKCPKNILLWLLYCPNYIVFGVISQYLSLLFKTDILHLSSAFYPHFALLFNKTLYLKQKSMIA